MVQPTSACAPISPNLRAIEPFAVSAEATLELVARKARYNARGRRVNSFSRKVAIDHLLSIARANLGLLLRDAAPRLRPPPAPMSVSCDVAAAFSSS